MSICKCGAPAKKDLGGGMGPCATYPNCGFYPIDDGALVDYVDQQRKLDRATALLLAVHRGLGTAAPDFALPVVEGVVVRTTVKRSRLEPGLWIPRGFDANGKLVARGMENAKRDAEEDARAMLGTRTAPSPGPAVTPLTRHDMPDSVKNVLAVALGCGALIDHLSVYELACQHGSNWRALVEDICEIAFACRNSLPNIHAAVVRAAESYWEEKQDKKDRTP